MPNMWKSSDDALKDITRIDDFGTSNEEELKADLAKSESGSPERTPHQFIDPRTGEEIDIGNECSLNRFERKKSVLSVGRAKLIEEYRQNSKVKKLRSQLRMNRPLGFGNDMIESYFVNHEEVEDAKEPSATTSKDTNRTMTESVVKGRRGGGKNVMLTSLLDKERSTNR